MKREIRSSQRLRNFLFSSSHKRTAAFSNIFQSESFFFGDLFSADMCKANPFISNKYRYIQRPDLEKNRFTESQI